MKFFPFSEEEVNFLEGLKQKRKNAQYYVTKETELGDKGEIKEFVLECKRISEERNFDKIRNEILSHLK